MIKTLPCTLLVGVAFAAKVTYSGWPVDVKCGELEAEGTLSPDGINVTTVPWDHTVTCMKIPVCVTSGYYLASPKSWTSERFRVMYNLDAVGNSNLLNVIRSTSTDKNFKVTAVGDDNGDGVLKNAEITECVMPGPGGKGCDCSCIGDCTTPPATGWALQRTAYDTAPKAEPTSSLAQYGFTNEKALDQEVKLHWKVEGTSIKLAIDVPVVGWASVGVGTEMIGADVVIGGGKTSGGQQSDIAAYSITSKRPAGLEESSERTSALSDAQVVVEGGRTAVMFTRPLANGETTIPVDGVASFVYAFGPGNTVSYHQSRSPFTVEDLGSAPAAPQPTTTTQAPVGSGALAGFDQMATLGPGVVLHYKKISDTELKLGIDVPVDGWAAVAVGSTMASARAVIGGGSKGGGSPTDIKAYKLSAKSASGVGENSAGTTLLKDVEVKRSGGRTQVIFTRPFSSSELGSISFDGDTDLLYAYGSGNTVEYHGGNKQAVALNLATGGTTVDTTARDNKVTHGALMITGWGFLLPTGTLIAAWGGPRFKWFSVGPKLFNAHRGIQVVGLVVALSGVIFALAKIYDSAASMPGHGIVGLVVMTIGVLQPLNAILRPHDDAGFKRTAWEYLHKNAGRGACVLGCINCIIGAMLGQEQHEGDSDSFDTLFLVSIILTALFAVVFIAAKITLFLKLLNKGLTEE